MSRDYLNNKDFLAALIKHKEDLANNVDISRSRNYNYIGLCIIKINENLALRGNFRSYSYIDEMIADGEEKCIAGIYSFDPNKSTNAYGYFGMIAWMAFTARINAEKKQNAIKHRNAIMNIDEFLVSSESDASSQIIEDYEKFVSDKKEKTELKKKQKEENNGPEI